MNYRKEPYPKDVLSVFHNAEGLANRIIEKLNDDSCKRINQLYSEKKGKIIRNKEKYNELEYIPNQYLLTKSKETNDKEFKGLYIFGEETNDKVNPVYVGISRSVFRRLKQHAFGKKHNECSLAYLKTKYKYEAEGKKISRVTINNEDMLPAKYVIQNYKVVLIRIENDYDLYFLEVALAGILKTKWNSFKTH